MWHNLRRLGRYRGLIQSLVARELKARYRGSFLGFFWSFVNPLMLLSIYTFVFRYILENTEEKLRPFPLFMFCGLLPWTWFASSLAEASGSLISGGNLIKKVLFPAEVLPIVSVLSNMVHFFLGLTILAGFMIWFRHMPDPADLLFFPLIVAVQLVFTLALSLFVAALTVHFRDIQSILGHLLHVWFFGSPILYYYGDLSGRMRQILRFNPMTHILVSYQQALFEGSFHHGPGLLAAAAVALVVFACGAWLFDRLRDTLAEEV